MFAKTVDGIDEVFVEVEDLEGMRAFYRDVLGFEEDFADPDWGAGIQDGRGGPGTDCRRQRRFGRLAGLRLRRYRPQPAVGNRGRPDRNPPSRGRPLGREDSRFRGPRRQHHLPGAAKRQRSVGALRPAQSQAEESTKCPDPRFRKAGTADGRINHGGSTPWDVR